MKLWTNAFNPKVSNFLEENPDKTMIGFWWAMYWRAMILILGAYLALLFIVFFFAAIIGFMTNI